MRYQHNAKIYRLTTHIEPDPRADHTVVTGRVASETDHGQTDFNLWLPYHDSSALPLRIQWHVRSFLLLTLEADDTSMAPALHSLLNQEKA